MLRDLKKANVKGLSFIHFILAKISNSVDTVITPIKQINVITAITLFYSVLQSSLTLTSDIAEFDSHSFSSTLIAPFVNANLLYHRKLSNIYLPFDGSRVHNFSA